MTPEVERMLLRHHQSSIVVDTNLLLLLVVGGIAPSLLRSHKRTSAFVPKDYELLHQVVGRFRAIATTPCILAELDNHARQATPGLRVSIQQRLRMLVPEFRESYFRSSQIVEDEHFRQVDLTDCGILRIGRRGQLVLTADFELYRLLRAESCDVVNFNQLRDQEWN